MAKFRRIACRYSIPNAGNHHISAVWLVDRPWVVAWHGRVASLSRPARANTDNTVATITDGGHELQATHVDLLAWHGIYWVFAGAITCNTFLFFWLDAVFNSHS